MNQTRQKHLAVIVAHQAGNLEGVLSESIAAVEARKADDARWAEDEKRRVWIADCRKAITDARARVRLTRKAVANAQAEHDLAIDDTISGFVCLVEALDGSNPFKDEFGHRVPGGKRP